MKTPLALAAFGLLLATPVLAQSTDDRVRLSFGAGLTAGEVDGQPSISASAGYRFAKNFSFEVEFTATEDAGNAVNRFGLPYLTTGNFVSFSGTPRGATGPQPQPNLPQIQNVVRFLPPEYIFPIPVEGFDGDGSTLLMTAGFRYEFPVEGTRFRPYISAGMGLSRTEQEFNIALATAMPTVQTQVGGRAGNVVSSSVTATSFPRFEQEFTHTGVMASAGVGASLRVYKGLSLDLNARYFRLDRDRNLGSFGGGVSYRF